MPFVKNTYYEVIGGGFPIIMIPGLGSYNEQVHFFAEKLSKKGFRIITIDLPGYGKSKKVLTRRSWSKRIKDIVETEKLQEFGMIGYSNGGLVCLNYIEKFGNPKFLILISTPTNTFGRVCLTNLNLIKNFIKENKRKFYSWNAFCEYRTKKSFTPFVKKEVYENKLFYIKKTGLLRQIYNIWLAFGYKPDFSKINTNVLLIYGTKDVMVPLNEFKNLSKKIKNVEEVELKDQNHFVLYEKPDEIIKNITRFVTCLEKNNIYR